MPLNQKHIDKLKEIYFRQYGVMLPDGEAWKMGTELLDLYRLLAQTAQQEKKVRTSSNFPYSQSPDSIK
ncbi:MAG: hypothetical protein V1916_00365 [Patescibacteria group bacterium]